MRSCIGRVSGPGLSSRNCQSAVCAADKRHERSGGRLWATSRNRGRAYHPLFGALALGSKNIGRLGGKVAHLFRSLMVFFSYHLYLHSVGERSSLWSGGGRSSYLQSRTGVVYWLWLMWVRGGSRMVLLSNAGGFVFFLLREALVTSVAGVFRFMCSWWSAYRQHSARYTAADPLLFADVYGRTVKKKADAHGYISASTG